MAIAGLILTALAGIAMLVFGLQILIRAFKTSIGWGLASLFVPLAVFVFIVKHWPETKKPFLRALACVPVYLTGFALMFFGGAGSIRITPGGGTGVIGEADPGPAPVVGTRAETPTLVLRTVDSVQEIADIGSLPPCTESSVGAVVLAPTALAMCSPQSNPFETGKTVLEWSQIQKEKDFFGKALTGQWGSFLLVSKKESGEYVDIVAVSIQAAEDGRVNLVCDADRSSRVQAAGPSGTRDAWDDVCEFVAENLKEGRFVFNQNRERPAMRFVSREGPALELRLVPFR